MVDPGTVVVHLLDASVGTIGRGKYYSTAYLNLCLYYYNIHKQWIDKKSMCISVCVCVCARKRRSLVFVCHTIVFEAVCAQMVNVYVCLDGCIYVPATLSAVMGSGRLESLTDSTELETLLVLWILLGPQGHTYREQ